MLKRFFPLILSSLLLAIALPCNAQNKLTNPFLPSPANVGQTAAVNIPTLPQPVSERLACYSLSYARAKDVQEALTPHFGTKLGLDTITNSLILLGDEQSHARLRQLLPKLDVATRQVTLEAKIIAVSCEDSKNLGVRWDWDTIPQRKQETNDSNSVQTKDSSGNLTVAGVAKKVLDSCVGITVYSEKQASYNYFYNYGNNDGNNSSNSDPEKSGEGSGIIMSEKNGKTYILTCAHVISEGTKFTVTLNNKKEYDASMVAYDSQTDIGVLSIDATGLQVAEFANSDNLAVGEQVIAIGCPGGLEFMNSLTSGYISALDRPISSNIGYDNKCIQVDAAINPGNSGGALFNMQGQVIGVNSSKIAATEYEGMGFAVPSDTAIATANSLIKSGYVEGRAKLGITYLPLTKYSNYSAILSALEEKGYKNAKGTMVINSVDGSSDLASKDVKQYDMIVAINGKTMTSTDVLTSVLADSKPGDTVKLTIARIENNSIKTSTVECKLMESKGDSSSQSNSSGE